jgi:diguanylate cyclase (GGDEF)-like protein
MVRVMAVTERGDEARYESARSRRDGHAWKVAGLTVLVLGLAGSAGGALLLRSADRKGEPRAFQSTASNITTTLATLLRRDADFVSTARGALTLQPNLSPTQFNTWYETLQGRQQEAGSLGTAVLKVVPAGQLAAFLARRNADPAFRALVGTPAPVPRGRHSRYCLLSAGSELVPVVRALLRLAQADWCLPSSPVGAYEAPLLQAATDTGQSLVLSPASDAPSAAGRQALQALGIPLMMLETPFYTNDARLASVADRRAAVRGWTISAFDVSSVIRLAVGANKGYSVALYHGNPGQPSQLIAVAGAKASGGDYSEARSVMIDSPWIIKISGRAPVSGLTADTQGVLTFAGGVVLSVLLFLLVMVQGRSRERALRMVAQKTGQLRHQALHDPLTGLPNRVLALDRAEQLMAQARRSQMPIAALYIDIDSFKHVNDTFGHQAGDEFLRLVAGRISAVVREGDTAARLSGDEFVALLDGSTTLDAGPELVAERLLEVLREPYDLNDQIGRQVSLTASIGLAHGMNGTAEELLADADIALHEAKSQGKDQCVVFHSGMHTAVHDRLTLEMDLGDALAHDQLFLVYQPTFDLESERAIGVEALLRWRHPTRGVIAPDVFIPIAEESGLIVPIGRWVLEQACAQAARWHARGHPLGMSVNVSGRQLDRDDLIDDVRAALDRSGLEPGALTLEITETTLMRDAEATTERLASLKRLGVRIAIDDFGTGYSSLAYLRQFPVDALKIDRSFISGVARSKQSAALINTLVRLGKTLNLETLAEGIEDRDQLRALQRQHCDQGQGFLFAKPLEVDTIESFLHAQGDHTLTTS